MRREPFRALRFRLTLQFTGLVLAIVLTGASAFYFYLRHSLISAAGAVNELAVLSILETVDITQGTLIVRASEFEEELNELRQTLGLEVVQLWSEGLLIAGDNRVHQPVPSAGPTQEMMVINGQRLLIRRAPVGDNGMLVVGRRQALLTSELEALLHGLLLIVPMMVLAALGVGWFMAGQSIVPVRKAFEDQRTFMADASHELRTPLSIVLTQAEVALDAGDDSGRVESLRAALVVIARTARQLGKLVDDLLFLSRADATGLRPRMRLFPLGVLLEEVVESFLPMAKQKGMKIAVSLPAAELSVMADPDQLQRLLGVLVDNALRYGGSGTIEVKADVLGKDVSIQVIDEGDGMAAAFVPRAFDRFVREDAARSRAIEGSGLGLSIARAICESHAGTIELKPSATPKGTLVVVRLPIASVT